MGTTPPPQCHERAFRLFRLAKLRFAVTTMRRFIWPFLLLTLQLGIASSPPKPYIPIRISSTEFRCLNRNTQLGPLLLPIQVSAAGADLLAGPIRLAAEPASTFEIERHTGASRVLDKSADSSRCQFSAESSDFVLSSSMTGHCDGFCWYEIHVKPKHPVTLTSLALEIPRLRSTARYLHTSSYDWSNISQGLPELGGKWAYRFVPYVCMGDGERGR